MVNFFDEDGNYSRGFSITVGVYAPDGGVSVHTDRLGRQHLLFPAQQEWIDGDGASAELFPWPGWHKVEWNGVSALEAFVHIQTVEGARRFAARYGPIWTCIRHQFPCHWTGINATDARGSQHAWTNLESCDWWLRMAGHMRGILAGAVKVKAGMILADGDWEAMGLFPPPASYRVPDLQGYVLGMVVNGMLLHYRLFLGLNERLEAEFNAGLGFLPALWQQLVAVIGGGISMAVCSACGQPYIRSGRAPKRGQRNYCPTCSKQGAKQRLSKRLQNTMEARHDPQR